ncbi:MAG: hypothetical protein HYY93_11485 [Planctomycetes bacterium]|nr:hypothetical protein [Planctomycetota bacterium]
MCFARSAHSVSSSSSLALRPTSLLLFLCALCAPAVPLTAQTSRSTLNIQGRLTDNAGACQTGGFTFVLRLCNAPAGGVLFSETQAVTVADGIYNIEFGGATGGGIPVANFNTTDLYIEIEVNTEVLTPRTKLTSVAFAYNADTLDGQDSAAFAPASGSANYEPAGGSASITTVGTITSGTWNGTTIAVTDGGTGAINASAARSNLGAAASGANSDITSLTGLSTALSTGQGGTGLAASGAAGNFLRSDGSNWASAAIVDADVPDTITASNYVLKAGDTMTGALLIDNVQSLALGEQDINGTSFVAIHAPNDLTAGYILELPADDGTPGQFLTTDGAGILTWTTAAGSGTVTSVGTGNGLTGGPIAVSGTIDLLLNAGGGLSKTLGGGSNELGIAAGGVTSTMMAASSVAGGVGGPISDATITTADLAVGAVTSTEILDGTIASGDMAASSVIGGLGGTIVDASITTADIAVGAVTSTEILDGTITSGDLGAGSVSGGVGGIISDGTIAASDLAAGSVAGGALGPISDGTITNDDISVAAAIAITKLSGVAASGANSDITSLGGLTTPLATAQGGTSISSAGASGDVLRSDGANWASAALTDGDVPDTITASNYLALLGGTMSAAINMNGNQLNNISILNFQSAPSLETNFAGTTTMNLQNIDAGNVMNVVVEGTVSASAPTLAGHLVTKAFADSTYLTAGTAYQQNGNTFGAAGILGTNDAFDLSLETNNSIRVTVDDPTGDLILATGNLGSSNPTGFSILGLAGIDVHLDDDGGTAGSFRILNDANTVEFSIDETGPITAVGPLTFAVGGVIASTAANPMSLDTGGAGGVVNVGGGNFNKTINIGTGTAADTINIGTGGGTNLITLGTSSDQLSVPAPIVGLTALYFEGSSVDGNNLQFSITDPTAPRVITFPDANGTIALSGSTNIFTAPQTFAADLTLSGVLLGASPLVFEGSTVDVNDTTLSVADPTGPRTITLPDATGTVAILGAGISQIFGGNVSFLDTTFSGNTLGGNAMRFDGATMDANQTTLAIADPTGSRTITLPDATGTVALLGASIPQTFAGNVSFLDTTFSGNTLGGNAMRFEGSTVDVNQTTLAIADPTASRTVTLPDASGTVALLGAAIAQTFGGNVSFLDTTFSGNTLGGNAMRFEGATADANQTTLAIADPTGSRTITLPDATGTLALTSDIPANSFSQGGNSFAGLATLGTNDAFDLAFEINNSEKMRLDSFGNLGIGVPGPQAPVHAVKDDANNTTSSIIGILEHTTTGAAGSGIASDLLFRCENNAGSPTASAAISGILTNATAASESSALAFLTRNAGAVPAERMRVTPTGELAIGIGSASSTLHVNGDARFMAASNQINLGTGATTTTLSTSATAARTITFPDATGTVALTAGTLSKGISDASSVAANNNTVITLTNSAGGSVGGHTQVGLRGEATSAGAAGMNYRGVVGDAGAGTTANSAIGVLGTNAGGTFAPGFCGVQGASGAVSGYGVIGHESATTGTNSGVYGIADGVGTGTNIGVICTASGGTTNYGLYANFGSMGVNDRAIVADDSTAAGSVADHVLVDLSFVNSTNAASGQQSFLKGRSGGASLLRLGLQADAPGTSWAGQGWLATTGAATPAWNTTGADFAEKVTVVGSPASYSPGDVMVVARSSDNGFEKSAAAYDTAFAGVMSDEAGFVGNNPDPEVDPDYTADKVTMGMIGRVTTKVCLEGGPIARGDLLVTSSTSGHAMKGDPAEIAKRPGCIIGKALGAFDGASGETGRISVLVGVK